MGADLIGYIVIGPQKIYDEAIEKAAEKLFIITHSNATKCPKCEESIEYLLADDPCERCGQFLSINPFKLHTMAQTREAIHKLVDRWPPNYRDSCYREYNGEIIAFAGERSWGDEPEGNGYELLRDLHMSGVYEELGFK